MIPCKEAKERQIEALESEIEHLTQEAFDIQEQIEALNGRLIQMREDVDCKHHLISELKLEGDRG
jgi:FtsZ-binding cell division protein ZapB